MPWDLGPKRHFGQHDFMSSYTVALGPVLTVKKNILLRLIDLPCSPQLPAHLSDSLTLKQVNLRLPKHPDDLLYRETVPLHPDLHVWLKSYPILA